MRLTNVVFSIRIEIGPQVTHSFPLTQKLFPNFLECVLGNIRFRGTELFGLVTQEINFANTSFMNDISLPNTCMATFRETREPFTISVSVASSTASTRHW